MRPTEVCTACGVVVTPATSLISETGILCRTCFERWELGQRAAQNAASAKDLIRLRQASRLGKLHGVNWATALILLAGWVSIPTWLSSALIAGILVLSYAMRFRSRVAFQVAMAIDTAGTVAFLAVSTTQVAGGRLLLLLFPVVFAWWLGFLTWRARGAFGIGL